jgi:hypothetical protein
MILLRSQYLFGSGTGYNNVGAMPWRVVRQTLTEDSIVAGRLQYLIDSVF